MKLTSRESKPWHEGPLGAAACLVLAIGFVVAMVLTPNDASGAVNAKPYCTAYNYIASTAHVKCVGVGVNGFVETVTVKPGGRASANRTLTCGLHLPSSFSASYGPGTYKLGPNEDDRKLLDKSGNCVLSAKLITYKGSAKIAVKLTMSTGTANSSG